MFILLWIVMSFAALAVSPALGNDLEDFIRVCPKLRPRTRVREWSEFTKVMARIGVDMDAFSARLDKLTSRQFNTLFDHVHRTDQDFRERVAHSTLGRTQNDEPMRERIKRALVHIHTRQTGRDPFRKEGEAASTFNVLMEISPAFVDWLQHQSLKKNWREEPENAASTILRKWEQETSRRNSPLKADPSRLVNPDYESQLTVAYFRGGTYVSDSTGLKWMKLDYTTTPGPSAPAVIPRWNGNAEDFLARQADMNGSGGSTRPGGFARPILREASPAFNDFSGLNILQDGRRVPLYGGDSLQRQFIDAGAFGYHVTQANRLESIIERGWLLDQPPTDSNNSARTPGLHLSTHLGVTYSVPGQVVILRIAMAPGDFRPEKSSAYYGHVVKETPVAAAQVPNLLQFSPDGGVSWYPMTPAFVTLLNRGVLPIGRAEPLPWTP